MMGGLMQLVAYGDQDIILTDSYNKNLLGKKSFNNKNKTPKNKDRFIDINKDQNVECPIAYSIIEYGDKYYRCTQCKYNFSYESIRYTNTLYACPLCKKNQWTGNVIYRNVEIC
jgi:hypothetical protein